MPRRLLLVLPALVTALLTAAAPAGATLRTHACRGQEHFRCGTVSVPLDRAGRLPGTVKLAVAVERPRPGAHGYLLALAGGPGQGAVAFAESFRQTLAPALRGRRLVVVDQRGTGASGVLRCPSVQGLGGLDLASAKDVEACARRIGPRRQAYATADSVEDLDAVRAALGSPRLELMGVSYGTYVAVQYARRHPDRTDGLILDSVVGPDGVDPYYLDTISRLPRILREQCRRSRCRGATRDPLGDLARLTARLRRGPLRGTVIDPDGHRRAAALRDERELLLIIMSGDLNPWLENAVPAAVSSAVHGDPGPLLRLLRPTDGAPTAARDLSVGLNVTTACADTQLPYAFATPLPARLTAWRQGLAATPDAAFAPFSRAAVLGNGGAHDCLRWPQGDVFAGPSAAPIPDVPALLLSGRWDTRTPTEGARELLAQLPHGQLLTVGGTGHDVLDSDVTGCATTALRRWASGRAIGTPCRTRSNAVPMLTRPARSLTDYRAAPGVPGRRGELIYATLDAVADAQNTAFQTLFAGFTPVRAGGLRGGVVTAPPTLQSLRVHRYAIVHGIRVTGRVRATAAGGVGRFVVDGPGRLDGVLDLHANGTVSGVVGGRAVRTRRRSAASAASAATAGAGRAPARLMGAREVARAVRALPLVAAG